MVTERFLRGKRGVHLDPSERARLEAAISEVRVLGPRVTLVRVSERIHESTLLLERIMSRYIDDHDGLRVHVPGDFLDLHGFPLEVLDHDVATMTALGAGCRTPDHPPGGCR